MARREGTGPATLMDSMRTRMWAPLVVITHRPVADTRRPIVDTRRLSAHIRRPSAHTIPKHTILHHVRTTNTITTMDITYRSTIRKGDAPILLSPVAPVILHHQNQVLRGLIGVDELALSFAFASRVDVYFGVAFSSRADGIFWFLHSLRGLMRLDLDITLSNLLILTYLHLSYIPYPSPVSLSCAK